MFDLISELIKCFLHMLYRNICQMNVASASTLHVRQDKNVILKKKKIHVD